MVKEFFEENEAEWERAIGRFLIAFGRVEWFTYRLLLELPSERISHSLKHMGFRGRVSLIKELTPQRISDESLVEEIITALNQATAHAPMRNTIAHNPIDLSLFDSEAGVDVMYSVRKFHDSDDKAITLESLLDQCNKIEALAEKTYELGIRVSTELFPD